MAIICCDVKNTCIMLIHVLSLMYELCGILYYFLCKNRSPVTWTSERQATQ